MFTKRLFLGVPLLVLLALITFAPLPASNALALSSNAGPARLVNLHSGRCLEIYGRSAANLAPANQWSCWGGPNQTLQVTRTSDGFFELKFAHSNKCLEVLYWSRDNAAPIGQYDCHGGANQKWSGQFVNGSTFVIQNRFSQKCLEVYGWARGDGDKAVQWDCHHGGNQQWTMTGGSASVVSRLPTSQSVVALTFDAGSDAGYTSMILDTLQRNGIKAEFGITGRWAELNPNLVKRIAAEGHTFINHTYDHSSFTGYSTGRPPQSWSERVAQLTWTEDIIRGLTGRSTRPYFRPPYGDYDASVNADVGSQGYAYNVMWTLDSYGWRGWSRQDIINRVAGLVEPGSIIIFHVGSASQDGPALQAIIDNLRGRGYSFGKLADYFR